MEKLIVNTFIRLIAPLGTSTKRSLLAWLSAHLRDPRPAAQPSPEQLLDELTGAWADTPDGFSDAILAARTSSSKTFDWE